MNITLTSCQENALQLLCGSDNIFLTGVAGSGKSYLIGQYLKDKDRSTHPIVASTGAAAVLVRGVTFHSFFALGIMQGGLESTIERALKDKRLKKRLKNAKAIIIDEVSMIPGNALTAAEEICRQIRKSELPWGGIKIIAVGDFGQLPPVNTHGTEKDWAFQSEAWRKSDFKMAYLKTVTRSKDAEFLEVLNFIRDGYVNEKVTKFLNSRMKDRGTDFDGTILFPHRKSVEDYNLQKLQAVSGKVFVFDTVYTGAQRYLEKIRTSSPLPETLQLKLDALVMIRRNDPEMKYVNGSLGHIKEINSSEITITLLSGRTVTVEKESFSYLDGEGNEVASAINFPLNLAWASTIHKSQGMTLDKVAIDLSNVFEVGQAYVALSRARDAEGLFLTGWNARTIRASEEVKTFHAEVIPPQVL